jgi:glycosyltransferase involved in cell wall biosynthesis
VTISRAISPLQDLKSLWQLYRTMRRERFTVVHTHTPKAGLLGQLAARLAGVPIVINTLHGFYFHREMRPLERRFHILMETIAALCSDLVLSQNREDIETALQERICTPDRVSHLGNGIDLTAFDPDRYVAEALQNERTRLGIPDGARVVGFVGRLAARRKGFLDFLAAAQQIVERQPDTRFLIVGEADRGKPDAVEPEAARAYGVDRHCVFLGKQPNVRMPLLYRLMDVLVLPSLFEGLPRAIMEAAAMGVPAVATDVKGNREAVVNGRTGYLVPLGDVAALARSVLDVLSHPERADLMGEESRRFARQQFDQERVFATVKQEYRRLLRAKGLLAQAAADPRTLTFITR